MKYCKSFGTLTSHTRSDRRLAALEVEDDR